MVHELAEADAEGAYLCWHEYVTATGCFGATLQYTPMHRTHLIGVIGEVRAGASIVKREHATDEQRALVV